MSQIRIDRDTAHRLIADGAKLIDVRTPAEFEDGGYEGSVNIPYDEIEDRVAEVAKKTDTIVVYCRSGARSQYATEVLREHGYAETYNAGGLGDLL